MKSFKRFLLESEEVASTHSIPSDRVPGFTARIDKLNKVSKKLNLPPLKYEIGEKHYKSHKEGNQEFHIEHTKVHVRGESPKIKNWEFVGNRSHDKDTGIMTAHAAHGKELPKQYHADGNKIKCDHCGINRERVGSYVLKNVTTGEHKEVGKSCLKDFTGHDSPEAIAKHFNNITELHFGKHDSEDYGVGKPEHVYKLHDVMHAAISSIKTKGFIATSADTPDNPSTKTRLNMHFGDNPRAPKIEMHPADKEHAEKAIEHTNKTANTSTDYGSNLKSIVSAGMVKQKHYGYIAAAANAYLNHAAAPKDTSGYNHEPLGKEGDKVSHNASVIHKKSFNTDYGTTHYITAKTDSGHVIKTKTTTDVGHDIKVGSKINIAGKLGKHEPDKYAQVHPKELPITSMAPRTKLKIIE